MKDWSDELRGCTWMVVGIVLAWVLPVLVAEVGVDTDVGDVPDVGVSELAGPVVESDVGVLEGCDDEGAVDTVVDVGGLDCGDVVITDVVGAVVVAGVVAVVGDAVVVGAAKVVVVAVVEGVVVVVAVVNGVVVVVAVVDGEVLIVAEVVGGAVPVPATLQPPVPSKVIALQYAAMGGDPRPSKHITPMLKAPFAVLSSAGSPKSAKFCSF